MSARRNGDSEPPAPMTSTERVLTALKLGQPDRVPIYESVIDPKVAKAACPSALDSVDFQDRMDMDAVSCGADFGTYDLGGIRFRDDWGVEYKDNSEVVRHPMKGPISSLEDLRGYAPPDPLVPYRLGRLPELVSRYKGRRTIVFFHRAAFMWSAFLMGLDNLLAAFLTEPKLAHAVMDMVREVNEAIVRSAVRAGAEVVVLGDDYASNTGPLMSPSVFREFLLPRLQRVVSAVQEEGGLCIKHSDGNIWSILPMIVDTGVNAINPLEPVAGMDIGEVKAKYGHRVCLVGNIDCGALLSSGSTQDVREAVKKCIEAAGPGGGFILSSSNSIHSSVKPDNLVAMIEAGREYGKYPLALA